MSCIGCKCNCCAFNPNLGTDLRTPGEIDDYCYNCDECCSQTGKGGFVRECEQFKRPAKAIANAERIARGRLRVENIKRKDDQ